MPITGFSPKTRRVVKRVLLPEQNRGYLPLSSDNESAIPHCKNSNDRCEGLKELPSQAPDSSLTPPHQSCFLVAMRNSARFRHRMSGDSTNPNLYKPLLGSAANNRGFRSALTNVAGRSMIRPRVYRQNTLKRLSKIGVRFSGYISKYLTVAIKWPILLVRIPIIYWIQSDRAGQ